jgi:hypothetical protein
MPLSLTSGRPTILIRRSAFESCGLSRTELDERFNLTPDEFTVEAALIVVGPLSNDEQVQELIELLEARGLSHYDDFFDLSGNWPEWLRLYAMAAEA